jgi:hypothetical protein
MSSEAFHASRTTSAEVGLLQRFNPNGEQP